MEMYTVDDSGLEMGGGWRMGYFHMNVFSLFQNTTRSDSAAVTHI